ncbi:MAG TPA: tail fiber domain-containing protein, partial [Thermoanaerobaculia bacterium]|nr:tail fiber domain-containing protein [Thermoanaerobaculia bacterium]
NTASGNDALVSNITGIRNTASGSNALLSNTSGHRNTASGSRALYSNTTGSRNTASGYRALESNTTGFGNTASGQRALVSNTTGFRNTASGYGALGSNTTGARNTAVGRFAGRYATTGYDNIFLGSGAYGVEGEGNTVRIGGGTGVGVGQQNRTFIAGIEGIITANANAVAVLIDSAGQLGTVSSSREVKQDLREVGELSRRLLDLRPVAFRYKVHAAADPQTPLQFGLIAEEVAEVFPELVVLDGDGRPETVKYHLLASLLLNELQRAERGLTQAERELGEQRAELIHAQRELEQQRTELLVVRDRGLMRAEQQGAELLALRDRLTAVEQGRPPERSVAPWWRRLGGGGRDAP